MEKFICLTIHTERLHSDSLWKKIQKVLKIFKRYNIQAGWFSINPSFVGYQAMGYDEKRWIKRSKFLKESGQEIQQHTHFYKGREGVKKGLGYDLGRENVEKRILEDKKWLKEKIGITAEGFVSGAWKINNEIIEILQKEGYKYDFSLRGSDIRFKNNFLEIPTLSNLKGLIKDLLSFRLNKKLIICQNISFYTFYFHDYDLERLFFRIFLKAVILCSKLLGFKFISAKELYEKITR